LYNPEDLLKEIQKEKEKIVNELKEKELKAKEKEFKLSTPAKEFYAIQTDLYSKFDADGVPTHDAKGTEITKEIKNKLKKEFKKHEDNHKKWLETKNKQANPDDVAEKRIINQTQI
jgi:cysteinyl-tRNA synthetase